MRFEVPVYIESIELEGERTYRMQGLFERRIVADGATLERATARMRERLRKQAQEYVGELRHERLAQFAFSPHLYEKRLRLTIELRRRTVRGKYLFVAYQAFGRRLAFSPSLPSVWFDLESWDELKPRAGAAWREHLLKLEKKQGDDFQPPEPLAGPAWIATIDFTRSTAGRRSTLEDNLFAMLGSQDEFDGEEELYRVGLRLRDLYPHELEHVVRYDPVVAEVGRLLKTRDRRSVAMVGPRKVGKTAVLHEVVRRRMEDRVERANDAGHLWRLSPQRLISGMCYVGQWESRLLAILDHAYKKNLTLVFDNVLGLFQAGKSMDSSLTVGHVLKGAMQKRRVRVVAEMTPESLAKLRELDRAFADLFHTVRMEQPDERETHLILIDFMRRLEARHRCQFDLDVIPAVYDQQHRFGKSSVFPGKGCRVLQRLAVKHAESSRRDQAAINRDDVMAEFGNQTGLPMALIDDAVSLDEDAIRQRIGRRFVGQAEATEAAVSVFSLLEARLTDPSKPIATMLLVGPTGVGKTQFAKELARCFFGSPERLLRFDMNQFVTSHSASQLVGDLNQPEGLLTSAIRRQPFSVVLLDEIEKAHDDVHNTLLQVLGEGRLTDALGRPCDFTNCILLLTSNLGTDREHASIGFGDDASQERERVRRAVQRFFRPEFVNRLDRTIIFNRLTRGDMSGVARTLLQQLFERPGLRQRRCLVDIDDAALEWIVDRGYEPTLGARAVRRAIESAITNRVAEFLAKSPADDEVTLVRARLASDSAAGLDVTAALLKQQQAPPGSVGSLQISEEPLFARLRWFVDSRKTQLKAARPDGPIESGRLSPAQLRYYSVQEGLTALANTIVTLEGAWRELRSVGQHKPATRIPLAPKAPRKYQDSMGWALDEDMRDRFARDEIIQYMDERDDRPALGEQDLARALRDACREAAWIDQQLNSSDQDMTDVVELCWSAPAQMLPEDRLFCTLYVERLANACGADWERAEVADKDKTGAVERFWLTGAAGFSSLEQEAGWHFLGKGLSALELRVSRANLPGPGRERPHAAATKEKLACDTVVRTYQTGRSDWKACGLRSEDWPGVDLEHAPLPPSAVELRGLLTDRLPAPAELLAAPPEASVREPGRDLDAGQTQDSDRGDRVDRDDDKWAEYWDWEE